MKKRATLLFLVVLLPSLFSQESPFSIYDHMIRALAIVDRIEQSNNELMTFLESERELLTRERADLQNEMADFLIEKNEFQIEKTSLINEKKDWEEFLILYKDQQTILESLKKSSLKLQKERDRERMINKILLGGFITASGAAAFLYFTR